MTPREELDLILTLIRKYNLPLSPILEYAITEKKDELLEDVESKAEDIPTMPHAKVETVIGQAADKQIKKHEGSSIMPTNEIIETTKNKNTAMEYSIKERENQYNIGSNVAAIVRENVSSYNVYKEIEGYMQDFANLSVGFSKGRRLPHKAILLIGIMRLIENGTIDENKIPLEKPIADVFSLIWNEYFGDNHVPSVWTPFYHLKSESFWHFKAADNEEKLQMLMSFGGTPSVGKMRPIVKYAYLDEALFSFMKNAKSKIMLTEILVNTYINQ